MYDCIVVGAGPAGGSAAYHLAKQGRSVAVLEKEAFPRYKPCGGGVAPVVQEWFDFDFAPAISLKIDSVCYTWKQTDPVTMALDRGIWLVRRDVFDHFLVQQAQKQGAELREQTEVRGIEFSKDRWQVTTTAEPVLGRYLIAADGAKGSLANWLGFKKRQRRVAGALEIEVSVAQQNERCLYLEFGSVNNGYAWNFPKANGYSLGAGSFLGSGQQNLTSTLAQYSTLFDYDLSSGQQWGHPLFLWNGQQTLHTQNAVLAGESACVVDPFTAEGIRPSIFSGIQAAQAVDRSLSGNLQALEQYTQMMNEEWGAEMVWARRLAQVFYRLPQLGYQAGIKRPEATAKMNRLMTGELRYSDVARSALRRLSF